MPKRFHVLVAAAVAFAALWLASLTGHLGAALARSSLAPRAAAIVDGVQHAPFLALVVFGCYALFTIGFKLFNFNDCEEAAVELTAVRGVRARARARSSSSVCAQQRRRRQQLQMRAARCNSSDCARR